MEKSVYFVLMNGGLEGMPAFPEPKGEEGPEPNEQWVDVLEWSVKSLDKVVGFQTRVGDRFYGKDAEIKGPLFRRQVFEYAIRNGIGYGGDFIEIYDEDFGESTCRIGSPMPACLWRAVIRKRSGKEVRMPQERKVQIAFAHENE